MGVFEKNEKALYELRKEIVKDIRATLNEKGYEINDTVRINEFVLKIEFDRILLNDTHTDHINTDKLLDVLGGCCRVWPK